MLRKLPVLIAGVGLIALFVAPGAVRGGHDDTVSLAGTHSTRSPGAHCRGISGTGQQRADKVNKFVWDLRQSGASDAAIEARMADDLCIVPAETAATQPMHLASSSSGDVTINAPAISYDTSSRVWYAISGWKWNNTNFRLDETLPANTLKNIGGPDGFGTTFNTGSLILTGYSMTIGGGGCYFAAKSVPPAKAGAGGASFVYQDQAILDHAISYCNNSKVGQETITISKSATGKCLTVYGFAEMSHTWSTTSVTSASVGIYSLGFGWNNQDHLWPLTGQPGKAVTIC